MKKKISHTVTLTKENFNALSFFTELTGLSSDELVNYLLAAEFTCFTPENKTGVASQPKLSDSQTGAEYFGPKMLSQKLNALKLLPAQNVVIDGEITTAA